MFVERPDGRAQYIERDGTMAACGECGKALWFRRTDDPEAEDEYEALWHECIPNDDEEHERTLEERWSEYEALMDLMNYVDDD